MPGCRNEKADKKRFKKELGYGYLIQKKIPLYDKLI